MLNLIWIFMLIVGFFVGGINGKINEVTEAMLNSGKIAIEISFSLLGVMCIWTGIMNIAQKSGVIGMLSKLVTPFMRRLFPEIPKDHPAIGTMVINLVANFLGMGNAATPFGIQAMKQLQSLNPKKNISTNSMIMFIILNTAAIQLIPSTIISARTACGSVNPMGVIGSIWVTSIIGAGIGIIVVKIFSRNSKR